MSDFIHIEPAHEKRRDFARWALAQTPKLQTSSSTGTDVPIDIYPDVPPELLEDSICLPQMLPGWRDRLERVFAHRTAGDGVSAAACRRRVHSDCSTEVSPLCLAAQ